MFNSRWLVKKKKKKKAISYTYTQSLCLLNRFLRLGREVSSELNSGWNEAWTEKLGRQKKWLLPAGSGLVSGSGEREGPGGPSERQSTTNYRCRQSQEAQSRTSRTLSADFEDHFTSVRSAVVCSVSASAGEVLGLWFGVLWMQSPHLQPLSGCPLCTRLEVHGVSRIQVQRSILILYKE